MTVLKEGIVGGALNLYFIYKFLRILTTPWENTDAFKLGIIDGKGKILKKKSKLNSIKEKESYTMMHRLVWKLKRLMEKVPFGKSRLASYAAALWLIKEDNNFSGTDKELQESVLSFLETDWRNEALILKEKYEGDMDKKTYTSLKDGIDIKKASMKDVIKDFQSSDAPQFKGKSDKKKKEMAIAAKLSKEEVEIDEAKSKLPPHLAKFFDKKGNLKPEVAARVAKGKEKLNWIDVTPKGYGPKDEVYEIGTDAYNNHVKAITPGQLDQIVKEDEVDEKKVPKIKFKLKQFKQMKPKKKKKEHGSYSRYSDTSKGFAFGKNKGTSFGVGYNHNELDGTEIKEARGYKPTPRDVQDYLKWAKTQQGKGPKAVLKITDIEDWTMEIYKGIKAGWKSVSKSSLGGDENVAIMIKVTVEPEKEWPHKILQNASYGMIRIATDGTMEMFASGHKLKNMRKTKVKSARDVVSKINTWIKKVDEEFIEEAKSSSDYELYHKDFTSAMQHAYDHAKKKGVVVDKKEIDDKVATGPKKPSKGKTNRYELKAGKRTVMIQVANLDNKRYELNMYIEGKEELSVFSKFITEGRPKQDKNYVPGATDRDKTGLLRKLIHAQRKHYTEQEIKSIARKYKQNVADITGGKDYQDWDGEWIITLMNSIELTYDYNSNTTTIRKWKFDKKKAEIHLAKYGNEHETVRDMKAEGGGKIKVDGFEAAFELMFGRVGRGMFEEVEIDEIAPWKKGNYTVKDQDGKVLGRFKSGAKAQKFVDKIWDEGDYDSLTVELGEEVVYTYGLDEEAPANSVAGGNVNLDPFVKKKRKNAKVQWEMFGGQKVFVVSPERFYDSRLGKARYVRYEKYVGNDKLGETIRQYGRNNPKNSIILKNSGNGAMLYLKYGRK